MKSNPIPFFGLVQIVKVEGFTCHKWVNPVAKTIIQNVPSEDSDQTA